MKNKKKNKFYSVSGCNAYGVFDSYEQVMVAQKYIGAFKCKRFDNFEDAKYEAEERFWNLQKDVFTEYEIQEIRRINWCYYKKKCL